MWSPSRRWCCRCPVVEGIQILPRGESISLDSFHLWSIHWLSLAVTVSSLFHAVNCSICTLITRFFRFLSFPSFVFIWFFYHGVIFPLSTALLFFSLSVLGLVSPLSLSLSLSLQNGNATWPWLFRRKLLFFSFEFRGLIRSCFLEFPANLSLSFPSRRQGWLHREPNTQFAAHHHRLQTQEIQLIPPATLPRVIQIQIPTILIGV